MNHRIHVVVTCTQSKRGRPSEGLRMRSLSTDLEVPARCDQWVQRLAEDPTPEVPARNVYKGGHWSVALELDRADGDDAASKVWVASAGYGLLSLPDPIKPYAATFRTGHPDSVGRTPEEAQDWWQQLGRHPGPGDSGLARTLTDLVQEDPDCSMLIAVSPPYLRAMEADVYSAANRMEYPDRLLVVSTGDRRSKGPLGDYKLPVDARVQSELGGAMQSLNVRVARDVLARAGGGALSRAAAQARYQELQVQLIPFKYPERRKLDDEEVIEFIRAARRENPKASHSRLLRVLRESGRACEQSRFAKIFNKTTTGAHA